MALIGNISGSQEHDYTLGMTGTVVIGRPRLGVHLPDVSSNNEIGFFVSGSAGSKGLSSHQDNKYGVAVFGGDQVVSGALYAAAIQTGDPNLGLPTQTGLNVYANVSSDFAAKIDNDQSSAGHVLKLLTDGNGSGTRILEMEDGDGDTLFRARADGRFGFGPSGVSSMGAGTFVVGIDGGHTSDIAISKRLQHLGDSDTYLEFPTNDSFQLVAGNFNMLRAVEESNEAIVMILSGGAGTDPDVSSSDDVNFFVSGALDSKDTTGSGAVRGTAVFGGDLVVSGVLYGGLDDEAGSTLLELNAAAVIVSTKEGSENVNNGGDVSLFVSGAMNGKDTQGSFVSVFGGDVVVSGVLHGGYDSEISGQLLELDADQIIFSSKDGSEDANPGQDTNYFVSGAIGGKNSGATAVFGGDVVISGTVHLTGSDNMTGARSGLGLIVHSGHPVSGMPALFSNDANGVTISAQTIISSNGIIANGRGSGKTDTLDTAANIIAAVPGAAYGLQISFQYMNISSNSVTLAGGTGIGMLNNAAASYSISAGQSRHFILAINENMTTITMIPKSAAFNLLS